MPEKPNNLNQRLPKLRVVDSCKGVISDIRQVQWARDKRANENKPKLDISNRDWLACVKYALATNLHPNKTKQKAYYMAKPVYGMSARPPGPKSLRLKLGSRR